MVEQLSKTLAFKSVCLRNGFSETFACFLIFYTYVFIKKTSFLRTIKIAMRQSLPQSYKEEIQSVPFTAQVGHNGKESPI